ncbi:MAG: hypothetical protein WBZ37_08925, partial [Mycobacterium sp.]
GEMKWSLHQSDNWLAQWTTRQLAWEHANTDHRLIEGWRRPPEVNSSGWLRAFAIGVRHVDIVALPEVDPPASAEFVPPPEANHSAVIYVVFARPGAAIETPPTVMPFNGFTLHDGSAVILACAYESQTDALNQVCDNAIATGVAEAATKGIDLRTMASPRIFVFGQFDDATRCVWDLALPGTT